MTKLRKRNIIESMDDTKTLQQMILEMLDHGVKQVTIAQLARTSPEQISRIKNGQKSEYDLGKRIEAVYLDHIEDSVA